MKPKIILTSIIISLSATVSAEDYFDPALLASDIPNSEDIDLSIFSRSGGGIAGEREASIYVNNTFYHRQKLGFKNDNNGVLVPEFPRGFFDNILVSEIPELNEGENLPTPSLLEIIPYSSVTFDQSISRVDISIPQAYIGGLAKLKSNPDKWESGIPALLLDYRLSGSKNDSSYYKSQNLYASSSLGLNLLGWRLRTYGNYSYYRTSYNTATNVNEDFSFYNTYLESDIATLRSTFRLGELSTRGVILSPVRFRGAQLLTNDEMLNDNLRNYSPSVSGFANSQAVVTILQNDRVVYQTNVPAGPFVLNDFYISGYAGDLIVKIKEADGSEHSFIQAYSTLPEMKREGVSGFELSVGQYDNHGQKDYYSDTGFLYGSWSRGFGNGITLFGETLQAEKYQQLGIGSTLSLGSFGAVSGDISFSRANKYNDLHTGQSYGFKYSKSQIETGTTVTLATYRYSTKDFYTFSDFVSNTDYSKYIWDSRIKNRMTLNLNQSLGDYGYLSASASQLDYWTTSEVSRSVSLSHTFSWDNIYFNTTFALDRYDNAAWGGATNKQINFNISIPFEKLLNFRDPTNSNLSYSATKSSNRVRSTSTLTGQMPESNLRYRLSSSWGNGDMDSTKAASLDWNGNYINVNAGYTDAGDTRTIDYGLSGSSIMYPWGIAFGANSVMNGAAVIQTKGASGVQLRQGGETSIFGTAISSNLVPYSENRVDLDPQGLQDDIVLSDTTKRTIPEKGAVVLLDYKVFKGSQVVFKLQQENGDPLPFGTIVSLDDGNNENSGIVGDEGRVYLAGVPQKGKLKASWGKGKVCSASYNIDKKDKNSIGPVIEKIQVCKP
ncbi:fimbria/pilus outer membrane usher protein [Yersinia enterocolitica]|uniref:fimbria/pilus outer membrane usher protein n=1 Tax=Yersinia enterocolitica TaxID=630 RepID=UPI001C6109BB|nr:fimbria/pilus outer membrane usher protein [Yersinia enterocolitica]MBW5823056.1 fimbrial biogenesis outer membrane usher protein [Yersinia enterocolitica]MBW5852908.1 fimbrial biogenesis outer membrane usher protein [Yersinia enterocolitica]MBW5870347.1 fimbrial biogenesis outer membrane usher protein [Yersinia enterocolitica]